MNYEKLADLLLKNSINAAIIHTPSNLFYVSGYENEDAYIVFCDGKWTYLTDSRYLEEAEKISLIPVVSISRDVPSQLKNLLGNFRCVGYESGITCNEYDNTYAKLGTPLTIIDDIICESRNVKTDAETALIRKAAAINDDVYARILGFLKEDVSERDIAIEIEYMMKKSGAEGLAFDTIVAFGTSTSVPHHKPSDKRLKAHELITIDMGCKYRGFCSDITRTFAYGSVDLSMQNVYNIVCDAGCKAIDAIHNGALYADIDKVARDYITDRGYGEAFTHSVGHGVGIDIHEYPFSSSRYSHMLKTGSIVTVEPGIYLCGEFGVRVEELVRVDTHGSEIISRFTKELLVL